jgi:RND family efflux transporter MFP subunit
MKALLTALALSALVLPQMLRAQALTEIVPVIVTDWKAVYGRIEAKDRIPARARLGGTLIELVVAEGDEVEAGQPLGRIVDAKLDFQVGAVDAQLAALDAQLGNAESELKRGEELLSRGVTTAQRLDALRTQVDVVLNQIEAQKAQRQVLEQQAAEGTVLAPISGRVLGVPSAVGAVVMPGEVVAIIGGGGFFLRLAVPERHARALNEGDAIVIETDSGLSEGRLAKVYPQIENGRVVADVDVAGLDSAFVDARVLVRLPIGNRTAIMVPIGALKTRSGLDFVTLQEAGQRVERAVVPGARVVFEGQEMVEIVTGLTGGELVVSHE